MRVFVGLDLPEPVRARLARLAGGVPGARWVRAANLHVTLRFVGEVDGGTFRDIAQALDEIEADPFPLALAGLGEFGGRRQARAVWAAVAPSEPLMRLQVKVEQALQRLGLVPEGRKYVPHVTLARLRDAPPERVARFLADHADLAEGPWAVDRFLLFSSHAGSEGQDYRIEAAFPLGAWDAAEFDDEDLDGDDWPDGGARDRADWEEDGE